MKSLEPACRPGKKATLVCSLVCCFFSVFFFDLAWAGMVKAARAVPSRALAAAARVGGRVGGRVPPAAAAAAPLGGRVRAAAAASPAASLRSCASGGKAVKQTIAKGHTCMFDPVLFFCSLLQLA